MVEDVMIYQGDIIIVKDKHSASKKENGGIIEEGVPYFVEKLGYSSGTFIINILGKDITFFDTDYEKIEHIPITERIEPNVGDFVTITNDEKVKGALELGFREGLAFEVVKITDSKEIIISNGKNELWIIKSEAPYIKFTNEQSQCFVEEMISKLEENNIQRLIDKALDERDFEKLKELVKLSA